MSSSIEFALLAVALVAAAAAAVRWWLVSRRLAAQLTNQSRAANDRESLHRRLVERASDGIVIVREGNITMANPRAFGLGGYAPGEVIGRPFIQFIHPDHRALVAEKYVKRMMGDDNPYLYETALLHKDGSAVEVEISGGLMDVDGVRTNLVLIRDATARRRAARELREYSQKLELANQRLEREFRRSQDLAEKAEAANRSKTEFLASMSHELRTPLNSIVGITELLREEAFGPITRAQGENLATIDASSQQLLDLINDILDLAKLETGRIELDRKAVDVRALCGICLRFIQEPAARKDLHVRVDLKEAPEHLWADPRRLRQVLINLLGNAVKFTEPGGNIDLAVSALEGGGAQFVVADTGIGIPEDKLAAIFEPFERVDPGLSRRHGGAGLGLTVVKRLVAMHGGAVEAQSKPGSGSRFVVRIPDTVSSAPAAANPDREESWAGSLAGVRLLLAEDDEVNARVLALQLEHKGASVTVVGNGQEAIVKARKELPEAILMDIQMPVLNGIKATRELKADPLTAGIPVICLTALAMDEDRDRCLAAGADDYIAKPVNLQTLMAKLKRRPARRAAEMTPT